MKKTTTIYKGSVLFEANIEANGCSYLVIYGKHVNGYFMCIPNFGFGCEMSDPADTFWNCESMINAGLDNSTARCIAGEIKSIMSAMGEPAESMNDVRARSFGFTLKRA